MFMKKLIFGLLCIGIAGLPMLAQTGKTRPRIAATPTPPVIRGDQSTRTTDNRPPVLQDRNKRTPQEPQVSGTPDDGGEEIIKVETNLVTMPVSVLDRDGRFISGLRQQDFRIFENGIEQKVDYFQSVEQPFTVILLIDVSPSTQWQIDDIHRAAIAFVDQLRANDRVMVMAFDERVQVLSQPTNNRAVLRSAIRQAQMGDGTSLYEAVHNVIDRQLRQIEGRKAVVLFTDGVDTTSRRANYQSTVKEAEETDALIYPIRYDTSRDMNGGISYPHPHRKRGGLGDIIGIILGGGQWPGPGGGAGGSPSEYETGKRYLEAIAQNSGGRKFEADSLTNLDAAFSGIAEELRRQYSLGYYPDVVGKIGERKQIRIRVARPNVVVRAKTSYIVGDTNRNLAGR